MNGRLAMYRRGFSGADHEVEGVVHGEGPADMAQFRKYAGDGEIVAKIESQAGMQYVKQHYSRNQGVTLMAARGDLYVAIDKPHEIVSATRSIVRADPRAIAGSRVLLSVTTFENTVSLNIPDQTTVYSTINVPNSITIADIDVSVDF